MSVRAARANFYLTLRGHAKSAEDSARILFALSADKTLRDSAVALREALSIRHYLFALPARIFTSR